MTDAEGPAEVLDSRWLIAGRLAATSGVWVAIFAVQLVFAVQLFAIFKNDFGCIDLLVYRAGGRAVLSGNPIYVREFALMNHSPNDLGFTYPPFAALIFVPLAMVPLVVAKAVMVTLNMAACAILFVVLVVVIRNAWGRLHSWRQFAAPMSAKSRIVVFAAAVCFLLSEPVQANFTFGQINLILAAAVAVDILPPSVRWPRGLFVGLAVAVKLTPVVFVGYFVLTRQWRAAAVSLATAASAVLVSWSIMPANTIRYFTSLLDVEARVGDLDFASNQSMWGVMLRIPALDPVRGLVWATASMLVLALAAVAIAVNDRRGDTPAALLAAAFAGLLCSPVSWGHHWVWLSVAAVYFLVRWAAVGRGRDLIAGAVVGFITLVAPWTFLPSHDHRERLWDPLQHMAGSAWTIVTVLVLVTFASGRVALASRNLRGLCPRPPARRDARTGTNGPVRQ